MFKPTLIALALCGALATTQSQAVSFSGTTSGAATFDRAQAGTPPSLLSPSATAVPYVATTFTVSASGTFQFFSIALGGWNNFTFLYAAPFAAGSALTNALVGNDDYLNDTNNIGLSGFSYALTAGTSYVFVTTGYANTDSGAFTDSITGPGTVTLSPVPEPDTRQTVALGLAVIGLALRHFSRREDD
jgi:hypothetical protein